MLGQAFPALRNLNSRSYFGLGGAIRLSASAVPCRIQSVFVMVWKLLLHYVTELKFINRRLIGVVRTAFFDGKAVWTF
jgi:hypothetical protein